MDKVHKQTDKQILSMERKISHIYKRANRELEIKARKYFEKFKKDDLKKSKLVEDGKLTESQYKQWRRAEMMKGKRYKDLKQEFADKLLKTNEIATAYINGELPQVYANNYNDLAKYVNGVNGYSFSLTDAQTVKNLAVDDKTLLPYKYVDGKKDIRWNTKKVNAEILQGILQGDSIPKIAKRLGNVTEMNRASAIRNARTTVTSAECKGRQDSYKKAQEDGIVLKRRWVSTNDDRTRHWHSELDGVEVDIDEPFVNEFGEIMYPADPNADPANTYNCRCTIEAVVKGFKKVAK